MGKKTLIALVCLGFGFVAGVWGSRHFSGLYSELPLSPSTEPALPTPSAVNLSDQLTTARSEIAALKAEMRKLSMQRAPQKTEAGSPTATKIHNEEPVAQDTPTVPTARRIEWRISAIEKFVPLSEDQRGRLKVKFEREATGLSDLEVAESLEDILGAESAGFYREQVNEAFKRARDEEVDREVVWLSRQLALTPEQERSLKAAFEAVEVELDAPELPDSVKATTGEERVKAMIAENKRREELRRERLKAVLSPDQFAAYARTQAESSQSDIEVFHGAE